VFWLADPCDINRMIMFDRQGVLLRATPAREGLIAMMWGLSLLGFGVLQQIRSFGELSSDWGSLLQTMGIEFNGTPLLGHALAFAGALLLVHVAFGLVCWCLAQCTLVAIPDWRKYRWRVLFSWLVGATLWILIANATLFPWSMSGVHIAWLHAKWFSGVRLFEIATILLTAICLYSMFRAVMAVPMLRRVAPRVAVYGVLGVPILAAAKSLDAPPGDAGAGKPNIILIGVDSLRNDVVGEGRGVGVTPNIDAFLRDGAHRYTEATTPLARTYPAWVSVLTGRYPRHTGAREDLIAPDALQPFETLAHVARRSGYHTVWATDEVRFSNIDESYGFDQRITPTIGVADFLIGKANDFPLSNLLANSWVGRWLFPATYANRAAAHTYRPQTFLHRLDSDLDADEPVLLALHLTLPHNPFHWADPSDEAFSRYTDMVYRYLNCVIAADEQVGGILEMLDRKGMLGNALVVLLSDHGEALGVPATDTLLHGRDVLELLDGNRIALVGHGSSVLSPNQYEVVLAMRGYGKLEFPVAPREHSQGVSLVDIAPTVADLVGLEFSEVPDGASLRPLMYQDDTGAAALKDRVRFTETGFRTALTVKGEFDERGLLGEAAAFFRMNPQNARLEVRSEMLSRLISDKERAAFSSEWLLGAMPTPGGAQSHIYVFVGRNGEAPRRVMTEPGDADPELRRLWLALREHYGDELPGIGNSAEPVR